MTSSSSKHGMPRTITAISSVFMVALSLILAACGGGSSTQASGPKVLTAIASVGGSYTQNMSPFSPNLNPGTWGMLYEPLEFVNGVTGQETPMLASGHTYSADNKSLAFQIRQGVKWSDGQALTADDVTFTFNLLKQYPAADGAGIWKHVSSVTTTDPQTVTLTFSDIDTPLLPYIEATYVVPQHIWSSVGDPTKYTNTSPIGTGPMTLKSFTAQQITYVKNAKYWQADKVKVDQLNYPVVSSNDTALLKMASGQVDWTGIFSAALNTSFVQKDTTHNHIYMVPVVPVQIIPNLTNPLLKQLPVRQAISVALDRKQMATSGEAGLEAPANPTGLMPGQESYLDAKYNGKLPAFDDANPTKAGQILEAAGFKKGSDGIYADATGAKLSFKVTVPGDYSDYVQDLQIAQQNLQAAGIDMQLNKVSDDDFHTDRATGKFDLLMSGGFFGPTPYYYFEPLLNSTHANQGANTTNWPQWSDPKTDQFLSQYASTADKAAQTQSITGLSNVMADQLPVIPVLNAIQFFEYSTAHWTGWPTPENPYAIGSAYSLAFGDNEQVLLHLTPAN